MEDFNDCTQCDTSDYIVIQKIWTGWLDDVYIVVCNRCNTVEPFKASSYLLDPTSITKQAIKVWNKDER